MLIAKKNPWLSRLKTVLNVKNAIMLGVCALGISTLSVASEVERPSIWVKNSDRGAILEKIQSEQWAKSLFEELKKRADSVAVEGNKKRRSSLETLPLLWFEDKSLPLFYQLSVTKMGAAKNS
ncbi:hypothetical protein RS130_00235 [Paraglaciecola aquimarina]|uniref:Uncharacterized protein n=1 Tax=Paraglaciecola aquimarina TaxID=1235557 RepID=A0ABU3SRA9_9ALTE|nr:hypothetical protein [Paraglaciecola aquimarina]MDU0352540.1 hypothetical protein [Paraglaciecola aquimarina]